MKKLMLTALVALAVFSLFTESASAWILQKWRCNRCSTYICVKPYNAFTPVMHGAINTTGFCPVMMAPPYYGSGPFAPSIFAGPGMGPAGWGANFGAPGGAQFGAPHTFGDSSIPQGPAFTAPTPTPINPGSYMVPALPHSYGMMRPVAYQPSFQGNYPIYSGYPMGYNAAFAVPSYWYGNR